MISKGTVLLKTVTKEQVQKLIDSAYIRNTNQGFYDRKTGAVVGYYRTRHKRYIEDKYANISQHL